MAGAAADPRDLDRYRADLRAWFQAHVPAWWREELATNTWEIPDARFDDARAWQRQLFDAGYMGIRWPVEFGGQGLGALHEIIFTEEFERAEAPPTPNAIGIALCGPALLEFGTDAQKARFLRRILSAEDIWAQGYSEPGAGSDLAAVQTRAVLEGDHYRVDGQKIWTTNGKHADWIFALVRTDPDAVKQAGIGFLLIDLRSPGIEVAPLRTMSGDSHFAQVFFSDVHVPADQMVGAPNQGWQIANQVLAHERGADLGIVRCGRFLHRIAELARQSRRADRPLAEDDAFRQRWAALRIEFEALRQRTLEAVEAARRGEAPGASASLFKLQTSEFEQELMRLAVDVQGPYGQLWQESPHVVDRGIWQWREMWSRAGTIYGGSAQIQRNILAERVLGLPRK